MLDFNGQKCSIAWIAFIANLVLYDTVKKTTTQGSSYRCATPSPKALRTVPRRFFFNGDGQRTCHQRYPNMAKICQKYRIYTLYIYIYIYFLDDVSPSGLVGVFEYFRWQFIEPDGAANEMHESPYSSTFRLAMDV